MSSTITNGFDVVKVLGAFQGRLGWSQPTVAGVPALTTANLTATSGRYYEDFHEGVRLRLALNAQEDPNIGADDFNALLQKWDKAAIFRCLNAVFCRPALIEHCLNYERVSNLRNIVIPNQGNFCGYRIKVAQGNYAVVLNSIGLQFDGVTTFNIYLYNDLVKAPLKTLSVTTEAFSQTVVELDWRLHYIGDQSHKGGLFYVGYFQNDLPPDVHALDEQLNMWAASKIFGAYPFQSGQVLGQLDFNRINPSVVFRSYGISLELTSYKDYTQTIIQNAHLFDEVRGITMAIKVLEQIRWSYRTNAEQRNALEAQAGDMAKNINQDVNVADPSDEQPFVAGLKLQAVRTLKQLFCNFFPKEKARSVEVGPAYDREAFAYDTFDIMNLPPRERFY